MITRIQDDSINLFTWFKNNGLKANPKKSHLLLNCNDTDKSALIENNRIFNENDVYLLGITFENNMMFEKHVSTLCTRASQKLNTLYRIACYMDLNKRNTAVQLGVNPFSNVPFFLVIRTLSPTWNLVHCVRGTWNLGDVAFRALCTC